MKRIIIAILGILLQCSICSAQIENEDLTIANLVGKVKSIKLAHYKTITKSGEIVKDSLMDFRSIESVIYNEQGKLIEYDIYNKDGSLSHKERYEYDEKGQLTKKIFYMLERNLTSSESYIYNEQGKLIKIISTIPNQPSYTMFALKYDKNANMIENCSFLPNGDLMSQTMLTYNEQNHVIDQKTCYSYSQDFHDNSDIIYCDGTTFTYHKNEKIKETNYYKTSGKGSFTLNTSEFNKKGAIYKTNIFDEGGKKIEAYTVESSGKVKSTYTYDNKGQEIESNTYLPDGSLDGVSTSKYDEKGNVIYTSFKSFTDEKRSSENTFKYVFDENGNWIQQIRFYVTSDPLFKDKTSSFYIDTPTIIERIIEYYK